MIERFRIGQRFGVFDSFSMHDGAYCKFDDFAAFRARNIGYRNNLGGHMPGRRILADNGAYIYLQFIVEFSARA